MTQVNIQHVHPHVTSGSNRPHPLRDSHSCSGSPHQIFCHFAVWPKSPEAASGKFEQMWPTVTLTKNGFSPCAALLKEIRSSPGSENSKTGVPNVGRRQHWSLQRVVLLFPPSKDPVITFTMLLSYLQAYFHPKFQDRCWTSPPPCWR